MKIKIIVLSFFCCAWLYGQQAPAAIRQAFMQQGGMSIIDSVDLRTFSQAAAESTPRNPFRLIAVPAATTYNFYNTESLGFVNGLSQGEFRQPLNRQVIKKMYVYTYNGKNADFPFDYLKTIDLGQAETENFDAWSARVRKKIADWAIHRLGRRHLARALTKSDFEVIYWILQLPVDNNVIDSSMNRDSRFLSGGTGRRYTYEQLEQFLVDAGFNYLRDGELKRFYDAGNRVVRLQYGTHQPFYAD